MKKKRKLVEGDYEQDDVLLDTPEEAARKMASPPKNAFNPVTEGNEDDAAKNQKF